MINKYSSFSREYGVVEDPNETIIKGFRFDVFDEDSQLKDQEKNIEQQILKHEPWRRDRLVALVALIRCWLDDDAWNIFLSCLVSFEDVKGNLVITIRDNDEVCIEEAIERAWETLDPDMEVEFRYLGGVESAIAFLNEMGHREEF